MIVSFPQCRIIAGAVLEDPDAVQLFNFTNDRFTGLIENKFDIVFWTDFTANRDIFEFRTSIKLDF